MIDENEPTDIKVVDFNTHDKTKFKPFIFKVYNKDSIVRECSLNNKVSEKMKAHIMYGVNGDSKGKKVNPTNSKESTNEYSFYG